jgi:hypothetical protein
MRTALIVSVLLNVGLIWILAHAQKASSERVMPIASETGAEQQNTQLAGSGVVAMGTPAGRPFRWNQLESTDYRLYIKNLRAIGCPEQTIRDIITADVDSLYEQRARELEQKLALLANGALAGRLAGSQSKLAGELRQLPGQESTVIAALLGLPTPMSAVDASAPIPSPRRQSVQEERVSMPLVFANVDPASLNLDESRIQAINSLKQRFLEEVNGPGQDPNDPAYLERWQKAQPEVDSMLKGMIGINAFQEYDLAARSSLRSGAAGSP